MKQTDCLIVGGGPAGVSAAIWLTRLGVDCLLIEKNNKLGGQLHDIHNEIIDYPGMHLKNGDELHAMFTNHFHKLGCKGMFNAEVLSVNQTANSVVVQRFDQVEEIKYRYLIIATGAKQKRLCVPGETEMILRGEIYSASTDCYLFKDKTVAVVGGGDRAVEGAILMADAGAEVYLIHRSQNFKAREQFLESAAAKKTIKILTDTEVVKIIGEKSVSSILLKHKDGDCLKLNVDALLIRIGIMPNIELFKDVVSNTEDGLIVADAVGKTSSDDIFAIGDICTKPVYSSITTSVGQGAIVAKHLSAILNQQ